MLIPVLIHLYRCQILQTVHNMKVNCDEFTVYSMTDDQCSAICLDDQSFRTKNGVCVNSLIFKSTDIENKCSSKDGLIAYLTGNTQFGKTDSICLSVDPGIRPDDIKEPNIICRNGEIDINYNDAFPVIKNCKCINKDDILIVVPNTSTIRAHGICVDKEMRSLFEFNQQLYNETEE